MPLPRVHRVVQDSLGNVVPQVLCSVLLEGTGTLATLWQDDAGTIPLSNPMTSDSTYGSFDFYVQPAHYDLSFTKPGYVFQPLLDMQVPQDNLTLGTMAQQDAASVAITGGQVVAHRIGVNADVTSDAIGTLRVGGSAVIMGSATIVGTVAIGTTPGGNGISMAYNRAAANGIAIQPSADSGAGAALYFQNAALAQVGSIVTTGSTTAYNTASDGRLKFDVEVLSGALDTLRKLRPITHLWKADGSRGYGFVAHEVADIVDGVITGEKDAVDAEGRIVPQMIDPSKLVVWLVSAVQELAARVVSLETHPGI